MENNIQWKHDLKENWSADLISDQVDFKSESIIRVYKEGHFIIIKRSVPQEVMKYCELI